MKKGSGPHAAWQELKLEAKRRPRVTAVYLILRLIVLVTMVSAILRQEYESVFICLLVLVLFLLPVFLQKKFRFELPDTLEIIILLFIFAAEILGEISSFYVRVPGWDTMLHTVNGFLAAAIGFSLVVLLNDNKRLAFELSPAFMAVVAFCFSMTIGVLWEFFECGMDLIFHSDMQKDTIINAIYTVALDESRTNTVVGVTGITDVAINGESLGLGGYLDIGLLDTMKDLFVNFIGAVVFSFIGFFYVKSRGKGRVARRFIPRRKEEGRDYLKAEQEKRDREQGEA